MWMMVPDDLDNHAQVRMDAQALKQKSLGTPIDAVEIGYAYLRLQDRIVTVKLVNRREPKAPTP